jgi:hypothetical protein
MIQVSRLHSSRCRAAHPAGSAGVSPGCQNIVSNSIHRQAGQVAELAGERGLSGSAAAEDHHPPHGRVLVGLAACPRAVPVAAYRNAR